MVIARLILVCALLAALATAGCGGPSHDRGAAAPSTSPSATTPTPAAMASVNPAADVAPITSQAFGIHWLDYRSPAVSRISFGSVRMIGGNAVTWPMLQPTPSTRLDSANPAVRQLDAMVASYKSKGAQPLFVLGPTPQWAAERCRHGSWPVETCAPAQRGATSPWASYVRFLAQRYDGAAFEVWNEVNLRNGYNDTLAHLAEMQRTAYAVIKQVHSTSTVLSPTFAVTTHDPTGWLSRFLALPGGRDFDVLGVHLHPADAPAKAGTGPEWALGEYEQVRAALHSAGLDRPVWDDEINVGRYQFRNSISRTFSGMAGAAMVARVYVTELAAGVQRVFWYAGDDRTWGGTWMVNSDGATPTPAGQALTATRKLLVGATPRGCTHTTAGVWTCRFSLPSGETLLAVWTTGAAVTCALPSGVTRVTDVVGRNRSGGSSSVALSAVPQYVTGRFALSAGCG